MKTFLITLLCLPTLVHAQTIAKKADALLTAYSNQKKFSGAVLIAKEGQVVFQKAYGYADLENHKPNTIQTEFRVGSLTKMFTSTVILRLVEEGKLSLKDPVSKYLPGFAHGDSIQIINLLSHTSGIKGTTLPPAATTPEESVERFHSETLAFTPGSRFEYNNFNYILLAYIAEKLAGIPYSQLVQQKVLKPAHMLHSGLDTKNRASANKAFGYVTNPETIEWVRAEQGNVEMAFGAGALYSTIGDLYKWSEAISSHQILTSSSLAMAMTPMQNNYGMGWMLSDDHGRTQVGHTGSIPGFIANFMKFPKENTTIILLSNYQDVNGKQLSDDLRALVFGEPYSLPVQKRVVAVPVDVLNRYAGEYQLPNGFIITVSVEENKLKALAQGDPTKMELTPESDTKFFLRGPETEIEFITEDSRVKYMFVNMQGGQKFTKVK